MLGKTSIRRRIMLILIFVYIVSIGSAVYLGNVILKKDTARESDEKAGILLASMKATTTYSKKILRPKLRDLHKNEFILEGMSGAFISRCVADFVKKKHPDYIYRFVSDNPLNMSNKSTRFEEITLHVDQQHIPHPIHPQENGNLFRHPPLHTRALAHARA